MAKTINRFLVASQNQYFSTLVELNLTEMEYTTEISIDLSRNDFIKIDQPGYYEAMDV